MTASPALQRREGVPLVSIVSGWSRLPLRLCLTAATTLYKLHRNPNKKRNTTAKAMRNMHAPAYWPAVLGVKAEDQRGVLVEAKKTMVMDSMVMVMLDDDMDMAPAVEEGIAMDIDDDAASMLAIVACA
ncbi:hypothetical protein E5D57_002778 [Metarhizium anisopliae]|nr:hypothetical protein E5D57_002778 [Metarhizium anisopliae]